MSNIQPCDCQSAALAVASSLEAMKMLLENCCYGNSENGQLILSNGQHEINISTTHSPTQVFLSLASLDSPVCGADIDLAGTRLLPNGFVLYANVQSSECQVDWTAAF